MVQSKIILPGGDNGLIETATGILVPGNAKPEPRRPNRAARRNMLRLIRHDLKKQKKRADRIMAKAEAAGVHLEQIRLAVPKESPADFIQKAAGLKPFDLEAAS